MRQHHLILSSSFRRPRNKRLREDKRILGCSKESILRRDCRCWIKMIQYSSNLIRQSQRIQAHLYLAKVTSREGVAMSIKFKISRKVCRHWLLGRVHTPSWILHKIQIQKRPKMWPQKLDLQLYKTHPRTKATSYKINSLPCEVD